MSRTKLYSLLSAALLATTSLPVLAADGQCAPVETFAPGVISTDDHWEWRLTFTPSHKQAYWATSVGWWPGTREQAVINTSDWRAQTGWSQPRVASFSGIHSDFDPFISPDGLTLYFSSMRPVDGQEKSDMDLWMVQRTPDGWGEPVHLGREVNADGYDELYSSIDLMGNLYFARVTAPFPTEDVAIWRSQRRSDGSFGAPEQLGAGVNTPDRWEFNPEISPDGRTLVFVRLDLPDDLPDAGFGFGDLYVSRIEKGEFAEAINLGPCVNTANDEFHPTVDWGSHTLYFAQDAGAPSDFHVTELKLPR